MRGHTEGTASATCYWLLCVVATISTVLPSPQRATKLAQSATEILYIEDGFPEHRSYKLEDFFWTGSGDGAPENPWDEADKTTTIYKTKTVMSTVYISISNDNQTNTETETPSECAIDCETVTLPNEEIKPTPTFDTHTVTSVIGGNNVTNSTADRHFWLLTVIKTDGKEPVVAVLEKRLAKLYSVAFRRQQERHLGIAKRPKRQTPTKFPAENKPVNVYIHNIAKNEETNEVEVLYHVLVSGKPVAAVTAASDMRLVTDEEVSTELGFPIRTKAERSNATAACAEPKMYLRSNNLEEHGTEYITLSLDPSGFNAVHCITIRMPLPAFLKEEKPQSLARTRDTWLFIGAALATIFLLLLMVTIFTFCLNKRKRSMNPTRSTGIVNRQHIFGREGNRGHVNIGYVDGHSDTMKSYQSGRRHHGKSPMRPRNNLSNETLTSRNPEGRPLSSQSSSTTTSTTSSDISPLMLPPKHRSSHSRKKHRHIEKRPMAINKALIQKQSTVNLDTDSSSDKQGSDITLIKEAESRSRISPKSYLSMPSVKSFPRSSIPETLNKVLEPVSVLHLDMSDDVIPEPRPLYKSVSGKKFIRHGSVGCEDPGVIGPVIWDLHCKRLQNGTNSDDDTKPDNHTNRMRKRFHELLDDTFSLFGTSKDSQVEPATNSSPSYRHIEPRGHSAVVRPSENTTTQRPRPKTSDSRRIAPSPALDPPRGAWSSATPSPLIRPLSAGPFHRPSFVPTVEVERILADGTLSPTDPAVPLIAAIKTELEKCALPGSTNNLAE